MNEWHDRRDLGTDHSGVDSSRKNAAKTRGRPFAKGNPGRPKGARGRTTLAIQMLLDGEAEVITRKCIDLALEGDPTALKLCMERIIPPRREWPVEFTMPPLNSATDTAAAMNAIMQAVADGKILLSQALEFGKLLEMYARTVNAAGLPWPENLTDDELRAEILRMQAVAAVDVSDAGPNQHSHLGLPSR